MGLGPRLELRQSQQLVMTPQLQLAIKLLTLTNVELEGWISEQSQRWHSKTSQPDIIRSVSIGKLANNKQAEFARLELTDERASFGKAEWPETLAARRTDLRTRAK